MSKGNLKSRIFDEDLDVEKEIEEWAKKIKECGETTGHANTKYHRPSLVPKVTTRGIFYELPKKVKGKCQDCGFPLVTRDLTQKEEYRLSEQLKQVYRNRVIMK